MKEKNMLICAGICGSALEWYDFSLFGLLAPMLSQLFFPNENAAISLLQTFAVFATGFIVRPIGAFFWGYLGDKIGRKKTLTYIISLTTLSTVMIGFIPTSEHFGIYATLLLIFLRLSQGFSASGEYAGMSAYLYEKAPPGQKAIMSSLSLVGIYLGMLLALLVGLMIHTMFNHAQIMQWAWRIPFLLSLILGFIGYYFRKKCTESINFLNYIKNENNTSIQRWTSSLSNYMKYILSGIGIYQLAIIIPYIIFFYLVTFSIKNHLLSEMQMYSITIINMGISGIMIAVFAYLSERTNPLKLMLLSILGTFFGTVFFYPLLFTHYVILQFIAQLYLGIFTAMLVGPLIFVLSQWFPVNIRFTAISICCNFAATLFGGTAPLLMSYLQLTPYPIGFSIAFILGTCILAFISLGKVSDKKTMTRAFQSRITTGLRGAINKQPAEKRLI